MTNFSPETEKNNRLKAELEAGLNLFDSGLPDQAIKHLNAALAINRKLPGAHFLLAECLRQLDKPQQSIKHYKKALKLDPFLFEAQFNLALILSSTGDLNGAKISFRRALKIRPNDPRSLELLGLLLMKTGSYEEGLGCVLKASGKIVFSIDPNTPLWIEN